MAYRPAGHMHSVMKRDSWNIQAGLLLRSLEKGITGCFAQSSDANSPEE